MAKCGHEFLSACGAPDGRPCVLKAGHDGKHHDARGATWICLETDYGSCTGAGVPVAEPEPDYKRQRDEALARCADLEAKVERHLLLRRQAEDRADEMIKRVQDAEARARYFQKLGEQEAEERIKALDEARSSVRDLAALASKNLDTVAAFDRLKVERDELAGLYEKARAEIGNRLADLLQLRSRARALRNAQRAYLAGRGNEDLGREVAVAAEKLDEVLG